MGEPHQSDIELLENILKQHPDYTEALELLAHHYTQTGRTQEGLALDKRIIELKPQCPTAFYNFACSLSLNGQTQEALQALSQAIALGYSDFQWMLKDSDLEALRELPEFQSLVIS